MKTTVEISDSLMAEAKAVAQARGMTFRQALEVGLRNFVAGQKPRGRFHLRDGSFEGRGLQSELAEADMRRMVYRGRGE